MRKTFSLYTCIPIHDKLSLYTHALKLFLLISTWSIYKLYSCSKISFSFFQHTLMVYTKISLYTLVAHTQEFLFTPYLNTHTRISFHTLFTHTQNLSIHFLHIKNYFLFFIYRHNICSQHLFLFFYSWRYHDFLVHFIFRTTFLNENSTRFRNFNKHY